MATTPETWAYIEQTIGEALNGDRSAALEMIHLLVGELDKNILNIQPDIYEYFTTRLNRLTEDDVSADEALHLKHERGAGRPVPPLLGSMGNARSCPSRRRRDRARCRPTTPR